MSGLIKWTGKTAEVSEPKRMIQLVRREASREIDARNQQARHEPPVLPAASRRGNVTQYKRPSIIELPRWCCIYDGEMGVARYLWRNGLYVYDDSIELTPAQKRRYSADNAVAVPADFCPERERCAICGKWTPDYAVGGISCPRCDPISTCFGRTTPDRYSECRPSCGQEGFLKPNGYDRVALVPGGRRRNFGTQF